MDGWMEVGREGGGGETVSEEGWMDGWMGVEGRLCEEGGRDGGMDVGVKCDCYILCGL